MAKVAKAVVGVVLAVAGFYFNNPALTKFGYSLIVSNALDVVAQSLADKPRARRLGIEIEYSGTVEPRRLIYGQQKVSGMNVIPPWVSGDKNQYLHQVLVLAGHRLNAISTVYFDKEAITSIGSVSGSKDDGKVSSGTFAGKTWIRRYLGTSTQTVDYILNQAFPSQWDSSHTGAANAYVALMYEQDDEVYQSGKPEITCLVEGRRCYDPRLDVSPGANPTDSAYRAYTTNAALCTADYILTYMRGTGIASSKIDWDLVVAAANVCDEDCAVPGSTTQKRYTCNVTLEMPEDDETDRDNLKALVGSMMGHAVYRAGKWRLHAGCAAEPNFALTADDILKYSLRTAVPSNERYNRITGQFVDKAREYQLSQFEPREDSAYETADGGQFTREVLFATCDNQYEAQRNAIITLKRSRLKKQISITTGLAGFKVRPWDVGTLTLDEIGFDAQKVRCIAWSFNQEGTIDMTLMEEDDAVWDDPASGDYHVPTVGGNPTGGPTLPRAPAGFTVTNAPDGFWVKAQYPTGWIPQLDYFRVYGHTAATPFSSASVLVSQSKDDRIFVERTTTDTVYVWVTIVRRPGNNPSESDETPHGNGIPAKALSIATGFRASADPSTHLKNLIGTGSGTTTQQSTVTTIDASATPTYSWARTAGSTKISVVASTAQTTGFSVSGLANGEIVSATFTCTATSSGASPGTATCDVTVTFRREDSLYN